MKRRKRKLSDAEMAYLEKQFELAKQGEDFDVLAVGLYGLSVEKLSYIKWMKRGEQM